MSNNTFSFDSSGCEYLRVFVSNVPDDAADLELSFDAGATWVAADWNGSRTVASVLIGGPDADANVPQAVLALGRNEIRVRLRDLPETVVRRRVGIINVRSAT